MATNSIFIVFALLSACFACFICFIFLKVIREICFKGKNDAPADDGDMMMDEAMMDDGMLENQGAENWEI